MFTAVLFTIETEIQRKQPRCLSTDGWIKKLCTYIMEYYSAIERKASESGLMR